MKLKLQLPQKTFERPRTRWAVLNISLIQWSLSNKKTPELTSQIKLEILMILSSRMLRRSFYKFILLLITAITDVFKWNRKRSNINQTYHNNRLVTLKTSNPKQRKELFHALIGCCTKFGCLYHFHSLRKLLWFNFIFVLTFYQHAQTISTSVSGSYISQNAFDNCKKQV